MALAPRAVVSNTRPTGRMWPARGSNAAQEHEENEDFKEILSHLYYFSKNIDFNIIQNIFGYSPLDLTLSLMRPASYFEFETPGLGGPCRSE